MPLIGFISFVALEMEGYLVGGFKHVWVALRQISMVINHEKHILKESYNKSQVDVIN